MMEVKTVLALVSMTIIVLSAPCKVICQDADFELGSTLIFTNMYDNLVITVLEDGKVKAMEFVNSPEQKWTVVKHPTKPDPDYLEFQQDVVPYNELSGWENNPQNPNLFPRPLGLKRGPTIEGIPTWTIRVRRRWCLESGGMNRPLERDDCWDDDGVVFPLQLWKIQAVS